MHAAINYINFPKIKTKLCFEEYIKIKNAPSVQFIIMLITKIKRKKKIRKRQKSKKTKDDKKNNNLIKMVQKVIICHV